MTITPPDLQSLEEIGQRVFQETMGFDVRAAAKFRDAIRDKEIKFHADCLEAIRNGTDSLDLPSGMSPTRALEIINQVHAELKAPAQNIKVQNMEAGTETTATLPERRQPLTITIVPWKEGKEGDIAAVASCTHLAKLKLSDEDLKTANFLIADVRLKKQRKGKTVLDISRESANLLDVIKIRSGRQLPAFRSIQISGADQREDFLDPHAVIAQEEGLEPYRMQCMMIQDVTALLDHAPISLAVKPVGPESSNPHDLKPDTLLLVAFTNSGLRVLQHYVVQAKDTLRSNSNIVWYNLIPVIADANDPETEDADLSDLNGDG